jgi:hypothetical protein
MAWPMVRVWVRIPALSYESRRVRFVIDTGATVSVLQAIDAGQFGLSPEALSALSSQVGLTGQGMGGTVGNIPARATLTLTEEDGEDDPVQTVIMIADRVNYHLPSLLGWDVLKHFNIDIRGPERSITLSRP